MNWNKEDFSYSVNRKVYHDYKVIDTLEVGIELYGSEVKAIKNYRANFNGSYAAILKNELWLVGCDISNCVYYYSSYTKSLNTKRNRKLLCHKKEIRDLKYKTEAKGMTLVPIKFYSKHGLIKLLIGVCQGKNKGDKRESLKIKDIERDNERY